MIKSILLKLFYALLLLLNALLGSQWIYQADLLETSKKDNQDIKKLNGSVIITKDDITLTTNQALIYSSDDRLELFDDIVMISNQDTIFCDSLYYFPESTEDEYFVASGSIKLLNANRLLTSDSLYFWIGNDSVYASGNVYLNDQDLDLNAESLKYWQTNGYNGYSFIANQNVKFNSSNYEAKGSTIRYKDLTQKLIIQDRNSDISSRASIISKDQEIFGKDIRVQFQDSLIKHINITGSPLIYNNVEAKEIGDGPLQPFKDKMYGNIIDIEYENDEPKELIIKGMANSKYNVIENLLYEGYNEVSGDTIALSFTNEEINRIQVSGGCRGSFYPNILVSDLDTTISYSADKIDYDIQNELNYFYNNAIIDHSDTELESDYILVDWVTNKLTSHTINNKQPRVISADNRNPMIGDTLIYNLISKKGVVKKGKTELNDAFYHGEEIINNDAENIYSYNGMYTSCELDHPHYYFQSNQMKIVHDKHIIARPITLYIRDLAIMRFPFAILPNKGGDRKSGWIMPSFGYSDRNGTYFHNLGYYLVINDYSDMKVLSNFYDRKGIKLNSNIRYNKRYRYNGNISSTIVRNMIDNENGVKDISNLLSNMVTQSWNFKWSHSQSIDPSQSLNWNINYVSQNDFYQQDQVGYNTDTRLGQNIYSAINYNKNWRYSNNSLSISLSDSYDLLAEDNELISPSVISTYRTFTAPSLSFIHGSRLLFGNGPRWYNSIYYSIRSTFKFTKKKANYLYDNMEPNLIDTTLYNNGVNHKMVISGTYKLFKWFNISPKLNINESWIYGYYERFTDNEGNFTTIANQSYNFIPDQFKRRLTGDFSTSLSTKLYGMFSAKLFSLSAIRHIISPSVRYSYKPDFSDVSIFGAQNTYFQFDNSGEKFDYFSKSLVSDTPQGKTELYSFTIKNDFHGKFYNDNDYVKVPLISTSSSASYNPNKEQFKWSDISTSIYKNTNTMNIDIAFRHDLYKLDNGQRVNYYSASPRLVELSSGIGFNVVGKNAEKVSNASSDSLRMNDFIKGDYTLWDARFNFRGTLTKKIDDANNEYWDKLFWLSSRFKFYVTSRWEISYNARFDLVNHDILSHDMIISRPLHCWLFNFRWYPGVGESNFGSGFELLIRVKNPDLQDVRLKNSGGNMYGY